MSLLYGAKSSLEMSFPIILYGYLFLVVISVFSWYLIWNSFWWFLWAPAGKFLLWSAPSIHLLSVAGSLHTDILYFPQLVQNLFLLTQTQFIILNTSLFPLPSFLSLWPSVKFIRALVFPFKRYWRTSKGIKTPPLNVQTSTSPKPHCRTRVYQGELGKAWVLNVRIRVTINSTALNLNLKVSSLLKTSAWLHSELSFCVWCIQLLNSFLQGFLHRPIQNTSRSWIELSTHKRIN